MSSDALVANLRQDHALKMMRSTFVDYALVSKLDIQQIANLQTEQRTVQFANVNLDEYKKNVKVSAQEIENYYKQHPAMFKQVASVDVDYVLLTPANVLLLLHLLQMRSCSKPIHSLLKHKKIMLRLWLNIF